MKAARITAQRTIELFDASLPDLQPNEARVRLETACLCGSDSPFFNYDFAALQKAGNHLVSGIIDYSKPNVYPLNPGLSLHECAGTVTESRSDRYQPGDFVLALPYDQHGFFEHLTLPEARIFPLPTGNVSKEEILLSQPLGTILYGFRKLPPIEGFSVAIIGQGPIGLMMSALLSKMGAKRVIGLDKLPYRCDLARQMGAHAAVLRQNEEADTIAAVQEANQGELPDLVIEAAGHAEAAMPLAVKMARHDGYVFNFGVIDEPLTNAYPYQETFRKNLTVLNSVGAQHAEHFGRAAEMIDRGEIELSPLLTHRFPVDKAQKAYETFVDRKDGAIKVLIDFKTGAD